ncbi:hypothetical protein M9435_001920 [Picochlorum sp. BPE23]|nr:hypothetical protein M9435_001920 [Picochlorum sp. BPE23]
MLGRQTHTALSIVSLDCVRQRVCTYSKGVLRLSVSQAEAGGDSFKQFWGGDMRMAKKNDSSVDGIPFSEDANGPRVEDLRCILSQHDGTLENESSWRMRRKQLGLAPAWVEHLIVQNRHETMRLSEIIRDFLCLPEDVVERLLYFGAVHMSRIAPATPPSIDPKVRDCISGYREEALAYIKESGEFDRMDHRERQTLSKVRRVMDADYIVPLFSYVRVHLVPKRFNLFYEVDWASRVVAQGDDYIVMDKPGGLPVPPTVDNAVENVLSGTACGALGASHVDAARVAMESLFVTTRIDHPTEGLVIIGKNSKFVGRFNASMNGRIQKWYRAAVLVPKDNHDARIRDILGDMTHRAIMNFKLKDLPYLTLIVDDGVMGPVPMRDTGKVLQSVECRMIVHGANELDGIRGYHCPDTHFIYELDIELLTGRTHQIRAQLSAAGFPIIRDSLYAPLTSESVREGLLSYARQPDDDAESKIDDECQYVRDEHGRRLAEEPEGAIALQAYQLYAHDGSIFGSSEPVTFQAGHPWWHNT